MKIKDIIYHYKKFLGEPITNNDINEFFEEISNYPPLIIKYPELSEFNQSGLLNILNKQPIIILFLTLNENIGHWITIFKNPTTEQITFFDAYGKAMDKQNEVLQVPAFLLKQLGEDDPYLSILTKDMDIDVNHYALQKLSEKIATCGRHVLSRILFKRLNNKQYYQFMNGFSISPDMIATIITEKII